MAEQFTDTPRPGARRRPHVDAQALDEVVALHLRPDPDRHHQPRRRRRATSGPPPSTSPSGSPTPAIEPRCWSRRPAAPTWWPGSPGTDPSADALLVHGHLDVVPAEAADWSVHPFSGEIRDGVVWGRGAIDMKNMDAMVLATVRAWARSGRRPSRDIVLAFTADEEDSAAYGSGFLADKHADLFEGCTEGISESGAYTFHARDDPADLPGRRRGARHRLAQADRPRQGRARLQGQPDNAVSHLAAAIARIGEHQWPVRLTATVRAALTELAALHGVPADLDDVDALLAKLGAAARPGRADRPQQRQPDHAPGRVQGERHPRHGHRLRRRPDPARRRGGVRRHHGPAHRPGRGLGVPPPRGGRSRRPSTRPLRRDARGAGALRPAGARGAVLHVRRHRRQAVLPARHHRLRLLAAEAARRASTTRRSSTAWTSGSRSRRCTSASGCSTASCGPRPVPRPVPPARPIPTRGRGDDQHRR